MWLKRHPAAEYQSKLYDSPCREAINAMLETQSPDDVGKKFTWLLKLKSAESIKATAA